MTLEEKKEKILDFFSADGVTDEDVYINQDEDYVRITRAGIDKIRSFRNIAVQISVPHASHNFAIVQVVVAQEGSMPIQTTGSANPANCNNPYYVETAEARAISRGILKLLGTYSMSLFSEDEIHESSLAKTGANKGRGAVAAAANKI